MNKAEIQARFRARHPERAALVAQITKARHRAAFKVAERHRREFDAAILAECKASGIPRFPPPLPKDQDGRGMWQIRKTHCVRGHPYNKTNTYIYANGSRACRTCGRENSARWRRKSREAV